MIQLDLLIGHKIFDCKHKLVGRAGEIRLRRRGDDYEVDALLVGLWGWTQRVGFNVAFLWLSMRDVARRLLVHRVVCSS